MKISIFNINMWLLPFYYSKHNKSRLNKLLNIVKNKNPDTVTLQELPRKKHVKILEKKLPDYHISHKSGRILNKSALVTLSKKKPLQIEFFPFSRKKIFSSSEKFITKGILATHFKNKVSIYNTHFYLINKVKHKVYLEDQLNFTKKILKKQNICFLCGDLNMHKSHFDSLNNGFFGYGEDSKVTFSQNSKYHKKWWDRKLHGDKKIDYILVKTPKKTKISYKSEIIKHDLSDHYGIYSEITLD